MTMCPCKRHRSALVQSLWMLSAICSLIAIVLPGSTSFALSEEVGAGVRQPAVREDARAGTAAGAVDGEAFRSYLYWPRLHFSGLFQADSATNNNDLRYYNASGIHNSNMSWNPNGTCSFRLAKTRVTSICFPDGRCGQGIDLDPIIGSPFEEWGRSSSAKIVDLDPEDMLVSTIYGLQLQVGNFFKADVHSTPFKYLWQKAEKNGNESKSDSLGGATYHTILENITWLEQAPGSPFLRALRDAMSATKSSRLSMRLHLDQYCMDPSSERFTWGRVVGAIGPSGPVAPLNVVHGRELEPVEEGEAQRAPFVLDRQNRRIHADFGNSLMTTSNGSHAVRSRGQLAIGYYKHGDVQNQNTCSNDLMWLGVIPYRRPHWYRNTAGIESFPESEPLTMETMKELEGKPLVVAEVGGSWPHVSCIRIFLQEANHGTVVQPQGDFVFRRDAGDSFKFELLVSKFGKPLPRVPVQIKLGKPNIMQLISGPPVTNDNGIVSLVIITSDPQNPRKVIDGDVAKIYYKVSSQSFRNESAIHVLVWDKYHIESAPTWRNHVHPIFKLQATLYPAMRDFINLDELDDVIENRRLISMCMSLPIDHPNYMPVTRDLSNAKRKMILEWLEQPLPLNVRHQASYVGHAFDGNQVRMPKRPPISDAQPFLPSLGNIRSHAMPSQYAPSRILSQNMHRYAALFGKLKLLTGYEQAGSLNEYREKIENVKKPSYSSWSSKEKPLRIKHDLTQNKVTATENKIIYPQKFTLQQLRRDLQTALELEHATIPPYLTALYSVKSGHNNKVVSILKTVAVQEMLHMSLVANVLNAVGGEPVLTHPGFFPRYPTALPGGLQPSLILSLQNISLPLIKDVFMKIEEPMLKIRDLEYLQHVLKHMNEHFRKVSHSLDRDRQQNEEVGQAEGIRNRKAEMGSRIDEWADCFPNGDFIGESNGAHTTSQGLLEEKYDTIGHFYQHILKTLGYLTKCGRDNSIFTGQPSRQLTPELWYARTTYGHGQMVEVTDYFSAVKAIQEIVEQGEGSSPCMPAAADVNVRDLSHYFSFYSIVKGRMVNMHEWRKDEPPPGLSDEVQQWWKLCNSYYQFDGQPIHFDPTAVWPVIANPRLSDYIPWSRPYVLARAFSKSYSKLLGTLEQSFNGEPDAVKDTMGLMFSIAINAKRLVRLPIRPGDDPEAGPNAAPIFEPVP